MYIDKLEDIVNRYHDIYHRTIKMKSIDIRPSTYSLLWRRGVVFITTAQIHSANPEITFCVGSYPACRMSKIHNGENL